MSSGQTLITLIAFVLLSTILVNFYRLLASGGTTVNQSESDIAQQALAVSYNEIAQSLSFDEASIDSFITTANITSLTDNSKLGPDNPPPAGEPSETSMKTFDDFDDFNGYDFEDTTLASTLGNFHSKFKVSYVTPTNVNTTTTLKTFVKRLDLTIWRSYPPSTDTLRTSYILGYFHFD